MNETKTSRRQSLILNLVNQHKGVNRAEIESRVGELYPSSKPTIARDLSYLAGQRLIKVAGIGRSTNYFPISDNPLLNYFDLDSYFAQEPDRRLGAKTTFDFSVFDHLHDLFTLQEAQLISHSNKSFSRVTSSLSHDILHRELERFIVELAWKSSKIEGNTYSLLETETLIKENQEAPGHNPTEAIMILNHKRAFESILDNREEYRQLTLTHLTQLHNFIIQDLSISPGIRQQAVGITGTVYRPLDNQWQIRESLEKLLDLINQTSYPLEKALIASAMISYIQPFTDGNKRTGRMLTNAILLAHDCYPLSYRSVEDMTYKKALILFYEQNSLFHLKRLLSDQYIFATQTYFQIS